MTAQPRLTTGEAAARLGVHPNTLRRWANAGFVRSVRPPNPRGHRRFTVEEINRPRELMNLDYAEGKAAA